jgi:hypothetical protein
MVQKIVVITPEDALYPKDQLSAWFPTLPSLHRLGNLDLLRLPLMAIFCSRKCSGDAILKVYDPTRELRENEIPEIGRSHTQAEKDMLDILLKGKRISARLKGRFEKGKRLFCSVTESNEKRITAELANGRNKMVAGLSSEWKFIYMEQSGNLENLYNELSVFHPAL